MLCRPSGQPCFETEEFSLVQNMLTAAVEERYREAGKFPRLLILLPLLVFIIWKVEQKLLFSWPCYEV